MAKTSAFGLALARQRRESGFPTPYAFYRGRGGAKVLGMTFANYLSVERGKTMPKGWRLQRLLSALGVTLGGSRAQELLRAFVADTLGSEELLAAAFPPEARTSVSSHLSLGKAGLAQVPTVQLSLEQLGVLARDATAYACYLLTKGAADGVALGELARRAGASPAAVKKALGALSAAGLAKVKGNRVICPLTGKATPLPEPTPATASLLAALQRHRAAWAKAHGRVLHAPSVVIRARAGGVQRYFEHLTDAVRMAGLYHEIAPAEESESYLVEARVLNIFPSARG